MSLSAEAVGLWVSFHQLMDEQLHDHVVQLMRVGLLVESLAKANTPEASGWSCACTDVESRHMKHHERSYGSFLHDKCFATSFARNRVTLTRR
jgi:hypothetical protein